MTAQDLVKAFAKAAEDRNGAAMAALSPKTGFTTTYFMSFPGKVPHSRAD